MKTANRLGVTILELTIVILIVSILASISLGVYTGYLRRARFAVARTEIRELGLHATRHEVDMGWFPLSSSHKSERAPTPYPDVAFGGDPADPADPDNEIWGCGYLTLSLLHGANPDGTSPTTDPRWFGPYMTVAREDQGAIDYLVPPPPPPAIPPRYYFKQTFDADDTPPSISIKDPWDNPYYYVRHDEYITMGATTQNGSTPLRSAPFGETYFNPSTFQIFSVGPDGDSLDENGNELSRGDMGLGVDDINNFYTP